MKTIHYIHGLVLIACLAIVSCIENDIPYPRIQPNFTIFEVENQLKATAIDSLNRNLTVYLSEEADIQNVKVTNYNISPEGSSVTSGDLSAPLNLTSPVNVTLSLYQDYVWSIKAVQNIERYFTIANQVGASVIDVPARRVVAQLPVGADLSQVVVTSIKLGSVKAVMSPNLEGQTIDFNSPIEIEVSDYGRQEIWTIYVTSSKANVTTERVDAWTCVAWLYGSAQAGQNNGFEYRKSDEQDWSRVPAAWVVHDGGSFTARLIHLDPETEYVARAYSNNETGAELSFKTGKVVPLPNPSLDDWHLSGKIWNPWASDATSFWDTGNKGATTLGDSNTVPSDDIPMGLTGKAAKLETKFVGIASIGKLAAGNLFSGVYYKTDGTNGILKFGREFTQRPTRLTGYIKYNCAPISHTSKEFTHLKEKPDTGTIYIALADWSEPLEIRTNPNNRQLFDYNAPEIIAYGALEWGHSVEEYTAFDIELNYRDTQRQPRYILVVGSASKYGDYFTGGNGSVLYIDDLKLHYDYEN